MDGLPISFGPYRLLAAQRLLLEGDEPKPPAPAPSDDDEGEGKVARLDQRRSR